MVAGEGKPGVPKKKRWIVFSVVLVATVLGVWIYRDAAFDVARWQGAQADERARMLGDLLRRHDPVGKTRDQVELLLGKAELVSGHELYTLRFDKEGVWREHFMFVPRRLEVKYNADGVCTTCLVHPLARETRERVLRWYFMRARENLPF